MLFRNEKDKKDDKEQTGGPARVPLLPLRDIIVFPHMVVPLFVGRQRSIKALEEATQKQSLIFLSSQKDAKTNDPSEEDIYKIGTLGSVVQMLKLPDGTVKVLIEGKKRAKVTRFLANPDFFLVDVEDAPELIERNTEVDALVREVHTTFENEIQEIEEKLKQKKLSAEAKDKVEKELKKLKMMSPMSAEATVVRNYIDWILSLPWNEFTDDKLDINEAEKVLEDDHYGLEKVKERILEYLAVQSLVGKIKGPILCLVGPPGGGQTSFGKSIARATGRKFVRVSLGGVRDEAEVRGHRRTYIGALPGKIIQSMKKAGSGNPVFLLDEVDKMSTDFRGDPSSALLEVLDPEQNSTFNDHYLDVDYDLSKVMFVTTANTLDRIPRPLQDRMEIIRIAGYTELEKLNIAKKYLIPKQHEANGLKAENIILSDSALMAIIRHYTKEAGVRNLEREIASVCRKVAVEVVKNDRNARIRVSAKSLNAYLGPPRYRYGKAEVEHKIGVATGLAWTDLGGELLATEVQVMPGKGKLLITGRLGEVMQ